jgi:hypothetical protein
MELLVNQPARPLTYPNCVGAPSSPALRERRKHVFSRSFSGRRRDPLRSNGEMRESGHAASDSTLPKEN